MNLINEFVCWNRGMYFSGQVSHLNPIQACVSLLKTRLLEGNPLRKARHEDGSSTTLAEMTSAIMSLGLDYFFWSLLICPHAFFPCVFLLNNKSTESSYVFSAKQRFELKVNEYSRALMIFWLTENYQLFIKQTLQLCGDLLLIFVWCKSTFNMFWVSDKTWKSKTSPQAILWLASYASTPVIAVTGWIMLSGSLSVCTSIYCCKHDISQTAQGNFFLLQIYHKHLLGCKNELMKV